MTRYAMAIDLKRCFGCHTCAVACKTSNNLSRDVWWNRVYTEGSEYNDCGTGVFPNVTMRYIPKSCQHCTNAPCVEVCPTGASYIAEDGVVLINQEQCIGCKACITACPYEARTLLEETAPYIDVAVGDPIAPEHIVGTVEKCNFCHDRIVNGENPACMDLCPGRARFWGDLDDPESDISKLIAERDYERRLEDQGTEPSVYYLV